MPRDAGQGAEAADITGQGGAAAGVNMEAAAELSIERQFKR